MTKGWLVGEQEAAEGVAAAWHVPRSLSCSGSPASVDPCAPNIRVASRSFAMNLATTPSGANSGSADSLEEALKVLCRVCKLTESQFAAFRQFYDEVRPDVRLPRYEDRIAIPIDSIGLTTHESTVQAVNRLRSSPEKTAEAFWTEVFPRCINQKDAARQTVKLAYLIDPASQDDYPNGFRFENEPVYPVKWQPEQKFKDFFNAAFPTDTQDVWAASSKQTSLKAWKLYQRLKLEIVRTNDLAQHLVYNPKTKSLAVFHQVEWLKAQIRYTKDRKLDEAAEVSLAAGTLPPQLLVETLYTIYAILFPVGTNKKSRKFAKRLVRADRPEDAKYAFDHNLLIYDGSVHQLPANFEYVYWSRRLKALQALVEARPPQNKIVSWFERHTSERNALTVAIIGLFLSVLFSFLSLLVGILQVVVSTWAWKYPVQGSSG